VSQECVNTKVVLLSELLTNGWAGQIEVMPSGFMDLRAATEIKSHPTDYSTTKKAGRLCPAFESSNDCGSQILELTTLEVMSFERRTLSLDDLAVEAIVSIASLIARTRAL
jgi:hypothetical protein